MPEDVGYGNKNSPLSQLRGQVQTPEEDFLLTLMEIGDSKSPTFLDEAISNQPDTVEEEVGSARDILDGLNPDEAKVLVGKFQAMNPEIQKQMLTTLQQEDPDAYRQLQAVFRMSLGREGQVNGMLQESS